MLSTAKTAKEPHNCNHHEECKQCCGKMVVKAVKKQIRFLGMPVTSLGLTEGSLVTEKTADSGNGKCEKMCINALKCKSSKHTYYVCKSVCIL